jgi:hypothetical protein
MLTLLRLHSIMRSAYASLITLSLRPVAAQNGASADEYLSYILAGWRNDLSQAVKDKPVPRRCLPSYINIYIIRYSVRYSTAVYVLHVFQKKSTRGRETPQRDIDLIKERLKRAGEVHAMKMKESQQ